MKPVAEYVVYDPPAPGLPYLAVLFRPGLRPRAFVFQTFEQATEFLTSQARPAASRPDMLPGPIDGARRLSRWN